MVSKLSADYNRDKLVQVHYVVIDKLHQNIKKVRKSFAEETNCEKSKLVDCLNTWKKRKKNKRSGE